MGWIPLLGNLSVFNARKRAESRYYIFFYKNRDEADVVKEGHFFIDKDIGSIITDIDIEFMKRISNYEEKSESFLAIISSGGLLYIASMISATKSTITASVTMGAILFLLGFLSVAIIKIIQIEHSYFINGEWQKNRLQYIRKEIDLPELYWRTMYTLKVSKSYAVVALVSLLSSTAGVFVTFYAFTWSVLIDIADSVEVIEKVQ